MCLDDFGSIGFGITFIVVSLLFRYGAQMINRDAERKCVKLAPLTFNK